MENVKKTTTVAVTIDGKSVSVNVPAQPPGTEKWRVTAGDGRRAAGGVFVVAEFARIIGRPGVAVRNVARKYDVPRPARRWMFDTSDTFERSAAAMLIGLCVRAWPDCADDAAKYARETGAIAAKPSAKPATDAKPAARRSRRKPATDVTTTVVTEPVEPPAPDA